MPPKRSSIASSTAKARANQNRKVTRIEDPAERKTIDRRRKATARASQNALQEALLLQGRRVTRHQATQAQVQV